MGLNGSCEGRDGSIVLVCSIDSFHVFSPVKSTLGCNTPVQKETGCNHMTVSFIFILFDLVIIYISAGLLDVTCKSFAVD